MSIDLKKIHNQAEALSENMEFFSLSNGLKACLYKDEANPKVLVQLGYKIGSAAESSHEKGYAHLVEHMIFKGTNILSEGDIDSISRKFGADLNAFTSTDSTSYYFECLNSDWEIFIKILADCMENVRFDEQHLASELKAVIQEINMYEDDLETKLMLKALESLYPQNHPYHYPIIGYKNTLANSTAESLKKFYKRYYHPKNACLFVFGNFDTNHAKKLIKDHFENITSTFDEDKIAFPASIKNINEISINYFGEVKQEKILFYWELPGLKKNVSPIIEILQEILGSGPGSRLYSLLVDKEALATDASFIIEESNESSVAFLSLQAKCTDLEKIKFILKKEFEKIYSEGFTENEITKAKNSLALTFVKGLESHRNLISLATTEIFLRNNPLTIFSYAKELEIVTNSDLVEMIKNYFSYTNYITASQMSEAKKDQWAKNKLLEKKNEDEILKKHKRTAPLEEPLLLKTLNDANEAIIAAPSIKNETTLSCGADVVFYEKKEFPIAYFKLFFKSTGIKNKTLQGFLTDLTMQMVLEESTFASKQENIDFLELNGCHFSLDSEGLGLTSLSPSFLTGIDRLLKMFFEPKFSQASLEKHKEILINDILEKSEDAQKVALKTFYQLAFEPQSIFDWNFDDAIEFVENISLQDIISCHKSLMAGQDIIISVAGHIDASSTIEFLNQKLSCLDKISAATIPYPERATSAVKAFVEMQKDQAFFLLGNSSESTVHNENGLELGLINIALFYSLGSRLYAIREKHGLFYRAFGGFGLDCSEDGSVDYISAILNFQDIEKTKEAIFEFLKNVKERGLSNEELSAAKRIYLNNVATMFSDTASVAQVFLSLKANNLPGNFYEKTLKKLNTLSLEQVNQVAKNYIENLNLSEIVVTSAHNLQTEI